MPSRSARRDGGRRSAVRPADPVAAARSVCRRADLFDERLSEHDITYLGSSEGAIALALTAPIRPLDSTALALLIVVGDFWRQRKVVRVRRFGQITFAISATARELALAVLGRADGRSYARLGLSRGRDRDLGALDQLLGVVIQEHSIWLGADGTRSEVSEAFHLIDWTRWEHPDRTVRGRKPDRLFIGLSPRLAAEIDRRATADLPRSLVRALPSHGPAGRLGAFILSHTPLRGENRRVSAEACADVIGVPTGHRSRGRALHHLRRAVNELNSLAPEFTWALTDGAQSPVVVCEPRGDPASS